MLEDVKNNNPRLITAENDIAYLRVLVESEKEKNKDCLNDLLKKAEDLKDKNNLGLSSDMQAKVKETLKTNKNSYEEQDQKKNSSQNVKIDTEVNSIADSDDNKNKELDSKELQFNLQHIKDQQKNYIKDEQKNNIAAEKDIESK